MAGFVNVSFVDSPLVTWVQTFCDDHEVVTYSELCDGAFLNNHVMHEIDPRGLETSGGSSVEDRLNTWDTLMKNIKAYYQDVLQQYIVMQLPNVNAICRNPESEKARTELLRVLLLILGCAVQCERKEEFIGNIKQLDIGIQHSIVENIQEITDNNKNVFAIELPEEHQDEVSTCLFAHLTSLIRERDGYMEEMKELSQTVEELYVAQQQSEAMKAALTAPITTTTNTTPEKQQHTNIELAETKAKLRKLRQECEEKAEAMSELMEELDDARMSLNKLRSENSELLQDARSARVYRDELDIFKEKASRVDKYEQEINKYKDKLNELEFFKARVEELREDNGILVETKNMLEDQLGQSQQRINTVVDLEAELLRLRSAMDELSTDRDAQRQRIEEVLEENVRLELEKKSSFNESATLEEELVKAKTQLHAGVTNSLSTQIGETTNAKILRLELENQRLQKQLEDARQSTVVENATRTLELEKENHRLAKKVEKLQEGASKEQETALQQVVNNADLHRQTIELERTLETIKESSERQLKELEREKEMLEATVETLRERNVKTVDLRVQDIEKENQRMHERVKEMTADVSRLEYENRQLLKAQNRNKENIEKVRELEDEKVKLENITEEFQKNITTLKLTCDNYEKLEETASDLEVDNEKLNKTIDKLKETVGRLQQMEQANINLTVENQALKRNMGNVKQSSSKLAAVEQQKEEYERELQHMHRTLDSLREVQGKHEQLELDLLEMDTENQRLQRALEGKSRHVEELEHDIMDLEGQLDALNKDLEAARLSVRRLEATETERQVLEQDVANTTRQKAVLDKENKRLKQAVELRAASVDQLSGQLASLTHENREHQKQAERSRDAVVRLRELEKENLELTQQTGVDKRTVSTLREDLVQEKIRTQQLSNDLEKLTYDLEKVGIKKEKLAMVQDATGPLSDESKFRALEGLMQEALTKKMELKDEKIHTLQSRLEESVSRNQRLQEELTGVRQQLAVLDQIREEDALVMTPQGYAKNTSAPKREKPVLPPKPMMTQSATKDILELKDHLITVERTNASLETENKNLHVQLDCLQSRLQESESQIIAVRENLTQQQQQFHALQQQFAKLQVESTTYQAQNSSLHSQNMTLQRQHTQLETSHEQLMATCDELRGTHEALVVDHDSLQHLHEQLTGEYEALISEHGSLKANHKQLRTELKDQHEQTNVLQREKQALTELKHTIEQERESLKSETKSLGNLQMDYVHVKQDNILLKSTHEKVSREYADLAAEHKVVKTEYNQLQLKYTSQQGQLSEARNQLNMFDVDIAKLASKCEMLSSLNTKLEEENRTLMMQLQALLNQNQELLTQVMDSKDHFHEEERAYRDKLAELRRQKEKLEEKIIEQYKRYDPIKRKNRGFAANLAQKARGLFGRTRSKERPQTMDGSETFPHDSTENSSLGSGSMGDTNESPSERIRNKKKRERRNSAGDLLDSPQLSRQNKVLAQSTTALNAFRGAYKPTAAFSLRGAKSSENVMTVETPKSGHHHGDDDSMSSENSASRNTEWTSRPPRRRHLLDSSGSSAVLQNNLSGLQHSSQSSEEATTDGLDKCDRVDMEEGDTEDDGDLISLNQFLNESNRSPKSRRKLLISKKIDPEEIKAEPLETAAERPPKFLTPRHPLIEENVKPKTPKGARKCMQASKSEVNLSTLSKQISGSSINSFIKHNHDIKTSTPKQQYGHGYRGSYGVSHQRLSSNSSQPSQSSGSDGRPSSHPDAPVYATIRSTTSASNLQQRAVEYNGYERDRNNVYNNDHANLNYSGSMPRKFGSHIPQPRHDDSAYTPMVRSAQHNGGGSQSMPRQPTSLRVEPREATPGGYMGMEGNKRPSVSPNHPDNGRDNGYGEQLTSWGHHRSSPPEVPPSARQHQPDGSDSQYTPGNVRNLVQTYHMTVSQPPSPNSASSSGVPPHQPPVPPPRRSRPLSAGGNLGSMASSGMGGNGSAFSTPRPQSAVPSGYGTSGQNHSTGNNNNNNFSPDGNKGLARAGSTPPRPSPTGREGVPKNSLWYEYGCI